MNQLQAHEHSVIKASSTSTGQCILTFDIQGIFFNGTEASETEILT